MKQTYIFGIFLAAVSLVLFAWSLAAERGRTERDSRTGNMTAVELKSAQPITPIQKQSVAETSGKDTPTVNPSLSPSQTSVSYVLEWQVLSSGGGRQTSASYEMNSTVGQTAAGQSSSASYQMNAGFQQDFFGGGGGGCCASLSLDGKTGNVDGDPGKGVDISDLSALIDYLYITFTPPVCLQSANIDGDSGGGVDIADLSGLIDFLYISFTPPAACQ
jgi:hypothetical protein